MTTFEMVVVVSALRSAEGFILSLSKGLVSVVMNNKQRIAGRSSKNKDHEVPGLRLFAAIICPRAGVTHEAPVRPGGENGYEEWIKGSRTACSWNTTGRVAKQEICSPTGPALYENVTQ